MKKVMTREELIEEIADIIVDDLDSMIVEKYREVLIEGYEGLENMPDSELIEEYAYYKDYQTEDIEIKDIEVLRGDDRCRHAPIFKSDGQRYNPTFCNNNVEYRGLFFLKRDVEERPKSYKRRLWSV